MSSMNILLPCLCLLNVLVSFLLAPTGITALGSSGVKQLLLIVFCKYLHRVCSELQTHSAPPNGCQAAGVHSYSDFESVGFQGCSRVAEMGMGQATLKHHDTCSSYQDSATFPEQCSLDGCKPVVNFPSSKNVSFEYFCKCSCCFNGGVGFQMLLLYHSRSASLSALLNFTHHLGHRLVVNSIRISMCS